MKKVLFILLFTVVLCICVSCEAAKEPAYISTLSAAEVSTAVSSSVSSISLLTEADPDYIQYGMNLDTSIMEDCVIFIQNAGNSIDEFGIIKANSDDTAAVEEIIKNYLTRRNDEWTGMYLVEEYPKLRDAEYKVFGRYIVYGILSETDKTSLFNAVSDTVSE